MMGPVPWTFLPDPQECYAPVSVARKILDNERLTDIERTELRRNLHAIVAEMRTIFMTERRWE